MIFKSFNKTVFIARQQHPSQIFPIFNFLRYNLSNWEVLINKKIVEAQFKGTVRPDWIYMRVVPLDSLEKDINRVLIF